MSSAASVAEPEPGILYVDTSALVKLVVREAESDALEAELGRWSDLVTSVITSIELSRAVARARTDSTAVVADQDTVVGVLAAVAEIPLSDDVRANAASLTPVELRTLDAIHLASALALGDDLGAVVTYDSRMQAAVLDTGRSLIAPKPVPVEPGEQQETGG
jgi:predicted nucleic acid-binding protein